MSIYSRAWSLKGAGIKMNYYIIIVFWVIAIIGGVIAFLTNNVIFTILEVVTLIMSIFGVWVCSN